jgi:thioesterase domain-containing protein
VAAEPGTAGGTTIGEAAGRGRPPRARLTELRTGSAGPPLYCMHALGGGALSYGALAAQLDAARPVYGIEPVDGLGLVPGRSLADVAGRYAEQLLATGQRGPCVLAGWSSGGVLAFETACRFAAAGGQVAAVVLLDAVLPETIRTALSADIAAIEEMMASGLTPQALRDLVANGGGVAPIGMALSDIVRHLGLNGVDLLRYWREQLSGLVYHRPSRFEGRAVLLAASEHEPAFRREQAAGWAKYVATLEVRTVTGGHFTLLRRPAVDAVAAFLDEFLAGTGIHPHAGRWEQP